VIDHHVDRPGVEARQRAQLTGPNRPIGSIFVPRVTREQTPCMEIIPRELPRGAHDQRAHNQTQHTRKHTRTETTLTHTERVDWTTWWSWRGSPTRSHPELGRENPLRPWYCASRHGRVGRRQVFQSTLTTHTHAGWSSPVARQAHNLKVTGSNPVPATILTCPTTLPSPQRPYACRREPPRPGA
jgi:hypothetical protein